MSIASEIERIKTNISDAYTKLQEKGATIPQTKNSANLITAIDSISAGGNDIFNYFSNKITDELNYDYLMSRSIKKIPEKIDVSNVESGAYMFANFGIEKLPDFDFSNLTNVSSMFNGCYELKEIGNLNFVNVEKASGCFLTCQNLHTISNINISKLISTADYGSFSNPGYLMFDGCYMLRNIVFNGTIDISLNFSDCTELTHDSLMSIINALSSTTKKTINLGTTNLEKLTDDEKAIATTKGWTLV